MGCRYTYNDACRQSWWADVRVTRSEFIRLAGSLALALLGSAVLTGCARGKPMSHEQAVGDPNVLVVYASCALVPAVESVREQFEAGNPGKTLLIEDGEPAALVKKLQGGSAADVFMCLGQSEAGLLEREGLLEPSTRREIGEFSLVLATPASKPSAVTDAESLTSPDIKAIVMAAPGITSLGTDGKHSLDRLKVWNKIQDKLQLQTSPLAAAQVLSKGEADVGVMYDPCPLLRLPGKIAPNTLAVAAPLKAGGERPAGIQMVICKHSQKTALGQRFIGFMRSQQARPELEAAGIPVQGAAARPDPAPDAAAPPALPAGR